MVSHFGPFPRFIITLPARKADLSGGEIVDALAVAAVMIVVI